MSIETLLMNRPSDAVHHHFHRPALPPKDLLHGRRRRIALGMHGDANVNLELLIGVDGPLDASAELDGNRVGRLERFVDEPGMAGSEEVLILDVYVTLGAADVMDVGLLDGIVVPAALANVDLVEDRRVELHGIGVDAAEELHVPRIGSGGLGPVQGEALGLGDGKEPVVLVRVLLLPPILKVEQEIEGDGTLVVAVNVVPGLTRTDVAGVAGRDAAVEIIPVLGLEGGEEGVLGRVVSTVGNVYAAHEANHASLLGIAVEGGIEENALLMMSVGCGCHEGISHPGLVLLPGTLEDGYVRALEVLEGLLVVGAHKADGINVGAHGLVPNHDQNPNSLPGLALQDVAQLLPFLPVIFPDQLEVGPNGPAPDVDEFLSGIDRLELIDPKARGIVVGPGPSRNDVGNRR